MTQYLSMPLETHAHASVWLEDEELTFPSYPRRFHRASDAGCDVGSNAPPTSPSSSSSVRSDIESLLDRDESLNSNEDFWREVPATTESSSSSSAATTTDPSSSQNDPNLSFPLSTAIPHSSSSSSSSSSPLESPQSPQSPVSETCLEDYIRDMGPSATGPTMLQSQYQPDFQIKRLCFRDADGKLALTDHSRASVHKPSHARGKSYKTSRKLLKRALRRKSGLWEMASPKFAVAEFMLL
ncbi:LAFA_0G10418g1_1 [Lachancea sp. 'fantastica']|nr:LAFA_0G10418g1_1 [Lachancea sp. 'fantastica']